MFIFNGIPGDIDFVTFSVTNIILIMEIRSIANFLRTKPKYNKNLYTFKNTSVFYGNRKNILRKITFN